jgi:hypothetical protein
MSEIINRMVKSDILLLVIFIIVFSIVFIAFPKHEIVLNKDMTDYAKSYLETYNELIETNFGVTNDKSILFKRYQNQNPKTTIYISSIHGAGLYYDFNNHNDIIFIKTDKEIEDIVWSNQYKDKEKLSIIKILPSEIPYELDKQIYVKNNGLILIEEGANIYYYGTEVNPFIIDGVGAIKLFGEIVSDNGLILKSKNNKIFWTIEQAILDSTRHFLYATSKILEKDKIDYIKKNYLGNTMINIITNKIQAGYYKNNKNEFYNDLAKLDEYNIDENMKSTLWSKYYDSLMQPDWINYLMDNLIKIITGILIGIIVAFISNKYIIPKFI